MSVHLDLELISKNNGTSSVKIDVVDRLASWKENKEKRLETLAKEVEQKHSFFPQTDKTLNYNNLFATKTYQTCVFGRRG